MVNYSSVLGDRRALREKQIKCIITEEYWVIMMMRCADCNCTPEECEKSLSAKECPNCGLEKCCCWLIIDTS
jgi:hypothetical protein